MKTIIKFEDCQQDFLEWHLDNQSIVTKSLPFQTSIWAGTHVRNIELGKRPIVSRTGSPDEWRELKYKIVAITKIHEEPFKQGTARVRKPKTAIKH